MAQAVERSIAEQQRGTPKKSLFVIAAPGELGGWLDSFERGKGEEQLAVSTRSGKIPRRPRSKVCGGGPGVRDVTLRHGDHGNAQVVGISAMIAMPVEMPPPCAPR